MNDARYETRLAVLAGWAREAAKKGYPVPSESDLGRISVSKDVLPDQVDRGTVEPWLPTIQWLLKQASFGVAEPHRQLPAELASPLGLEPGSGRDTSAPPLLGNENPDEVVESAPSLEPPQAAVEVSLLDVATGPSGEEDSMTVVARIKPAVSRGRIPKWESDAHVEVRAAVKKFAKPLRRLLDRDANEGDTRLVVTDLLCDGLGYDKFRDLTTEYMVKQDFADYGIRIDKQLIGFIEVKRISQKLNERHLRQVQMYAVNEGVEWMVLTNGQVWRAYHLTGGLPVVVDMAFEVDLLGPESLEEKAEKLFYLHREALKRRKIDELWKHRAATSPEALLDILLSDTVLDAIRKEVKRNSGISTTVQDLATVLRMEVVDRKLIAK